MTSGSSLHQTKVGVFTITDKCMGPESALMRMAARSKIAANSMMEILPANIFQGSKFKSFRTKFSFSSSLWLGEEEIEIFFSG